MTALELFTTLRARGVVLTPTCTYGDVPPGADASHRPLVFGLHVDAPKGVLTDALRVAIRTNKAALVALVEEWSERAAIAEYCGGLSREAAEQLAWESLVDAAGPMPAPAKSPSICNHVWTQLTPEKAQCQQCQRIVPTVPAKDV